MKVVLAGAYGNLGADVFRELIKAGHEVVALGKPVWGKNCTHCMGCINFCPKEAIEYAKGSVGKTRYAGPESVLKS